MVIFLHIYSLCVGHCKNCGCACIVPLSVKLRMRIARLTRVIKHDILTSKKHMFFLRSTFPIRHSSYFVRSPLFWGNQSSMKKNSPSTLCAFAVECINGSFCHNFMSYLSHHDYWWKMIKTVRFSMTFGWTFFNHSPQCFRIWIGLESPQKESRIQQTLSKPNRQKMSSIYLELLQNKKRSEWILRKSKSGKNDAVDYRMILMSWAVSDEHDWVLRILFQHRVRFSSCLFIVVLFQRRCRHPTTSVERKTMAFLGTSFSWNSECDRIFSLFLH